MTTADPRGTYRELCAREPSIPIMATDWWLDATCGESGWDVVLVEKGGEVEGALPFAIRRRLGFTVLGMPELTPFLGPWLRPRLQREDAHRGREAEIYGQLIDALPRHDRFAQGWHHRQTNWLPFHWRGFSQTTCYTYVVADLSDPKRLWEGLSGKVRTEIRKAESRSMLRVRKDGEIEAFLELSHLTFRRQGLEQPFSDDLVRRIDTACGARGQRAILLAEDPSGRCHAGAYVVWDSESAYYLLGGADPELRSGGGGTLCLWHALRVAAEVSKAFDFEGSMIEPIERYFRSFGAAQVPYHVISSTPSRGLRIREGLGRAFGGSGARR